MGVDLRYLDVFLLVAEKSSLSDAAREKNIAVSAISRQIDLIEESVGQPLFFRHARKLVLTEIGKKLYKESLHFKDALKVLSAQKSEKNLRVGVLQSVFEESLVPFIKHFGKGWHFDLVIGTPKVLVSALIKSRVDVILTTLNSHTIGVDAIRLYDETPAFVSMGVNFPDGEKQGVVFTPYEDFWQLLGEEHRPNFKINVNSLNATVELVKAGCGDSVIPHSMALKHGFKIITPFKEAKAPIFFCTEKHTELPQNIKNFLKELRTFRKQDIDSL